MMWYKQLVTAGRQAMSAIGVQHSVMHCGALNCRHRSTVVSSFVLHSLRNIQPMQLVMQKMRQPVMTVKAAQNEILIYLPVGKIHVKMTQ